MSLRALGVVLLLLSQKVLAELPTPYNSVVLLPFDDHGWFSNDSQLEECFSEKSIKCVIEIGSWLGLSARFLAEQVGPEGKVYCVDNWRGAPSPTPLEAEAYTKQKNRLLRAYQQFLSNIIHANLTDRIIPIRMDSLEAAIGINILADLIYIDASHSEEDVFNDIIAWSKHLTAGGILCGDDWTWPEVCRAVEKAALVLGKKVYSRGNFWRFVDA